MITIEDIQGKLSDLAFVLRIRDSQVQIARDEVQESISFRLRHGADLLQLMSSLLLLVRPRVAGPVLCDLITEPTQRGNLTFVLRTMFRAGNSGNYTASIRWGHEHRSSSSFAVQHLMRPQLVMSKQHGCWVEDDSRLLDTLFRIGSEVVYTGTDTYDLLTDTLASAQQAAFWNSAPTSAAPGPLYLAPGLPWSVVASELSSLYAAAIERRSFSNEPLLTNSPSSSSVSFRPTNAAQWPSPSDPRPAPAPAPTPTRA